jgi:hypothetical protein
MDRESELLAVLADVARATWERSVAQQGSRAEWIPELVMVDDAGDVAIAALVADTPPGVEVSTAEMVMDAASRLVQPSTVWLATTVDSYLCTDVRLNERVVAGHTTLRQLYAQRMPGVLDCLFLHAVNRRGENRTIDMPYRVRSGRVQWLPQTGIPRDEHLQLGGRLAHALTAAMTRGGN